MELNLKKARRLEKQIRDVVEKLNKTANPANLVISRFEGFDDALSNHQAKIRETISDLMVLNTLRYSIRRQIETLNESCGINSLLTEEAQVRQENWYLDQYIQAAVNDSAMNVARNQHSELASKGSTDGSIYRQDSVTIYGTVSAETVKGYKEAFFKNRSRLEAIVDRLAVLNSTTVIKLAKESVDLLAKFEIFM